MAVKKAKTTPMISQPEANVREQQTHVRAYTKNIKGTFKTKQPFEISQLIDDFSKVNSQLIVNDGDPTMHGTSNPYQYNLYSDLIINPSAVSVSEFQKMYYTQPVIKMALTTLKNLIKNEIGEYTHTNQVYNDFIKEMIGNMDRTLPALITDMLSFLWAGFYVGEKKYVSDGTYIYVKDIVPLPAQSLIFRVDSQGQLKDDGIIQYYFNNLWTGYGNLLSFDQISPARVKPNPYASLGDFNYPWRTVWAQPIGTVVIPKDKCIHLAFKGLDGLDSPYGRSILRSAYDAYLLRTEMNPITRNAANFKASQTPVVVVDPNQQNTDEGETAFEQIGVTLENLGTSGGNNPALLFQGRLNESLWISHLDSTANLDQFVNLNKYYDGQMLLACLFQSDLMGMADKGSYALGETQADLVGRNVKAFANLIKDALIQQLVRPVLEVNFNERSDFGEFSKAQNVAEDVALNMDKLNILHSLNKTVSDEYLAAMLDIPEDSIEDLPANTMMGAQGEGVNFKPTNGGVGSNFRRSTAA